MRHRSHEDSVGKVMHLRGKWILLPLLCMSAMPVILRQYQVQEIFVALVALAFALVIMLILVIAFVLFHDGVRRAATWVKTYVTRLASRNNPVPREPGRPAHASLGAKH